MILWERIFHFVRIKFPEKLSLRVLMKKLKWKLNNSYQFFQPQDIFWKSRLKKKATSKKAFYRSRKIMLEKFRDCSVCQIRLNFLFKSICLIWKISENHWMQMKYDVITHHCTWIVPRWIILLASYHVKLKICLFEMLIIYPFIKYEKELSIV
jgi:hypothetical protein